MFFRRGIQVAVTSVLVLGILGCEGEVGQNDDAGNGNTELGVNGDGHPPPPCPGGTDADGDGYGPGCPAGKDCDDNDKSVHEGAKEICDAKDNDCDGQVDEDLSGCSSVGGGTIGSGGSPFPMDPNKDPNLKESNGVKLDSNGDLILGAGQVNFRYMWISNTYDHKGNSTCKSAVAGCRGTVSKVDTKNLKEVGRYFTTTCRSKPGTSGCVDVNGKTINPAHNHTPSRTAVDFNMDVWVANRNVHGGQPSATKIANDPADCIDRNGNGKIDTSKDHDGNGKIQIDCNADGVADTLATKCTNGKPPEFLGDDDECILFTANYGEKDDVGRSICLDAGKSTLGASNAWVGTFYRPEDGKGNNHYFKINGYTGAIEKEIVVPKEHHAYGCMADAHNLVWSTDIGTSRNGKSWNGNLWYFQTVSPYQVGKVMRGPTSGLTGHWKDKNGGYHHYGISINAAQHVWLGGWKSSWILRYKPVRTSFATLHTGKWTRIDVPWGFYTRGINADLRGKVWVAVHQGYLFRVNQSVADGVHNMTGAKENQHYWKTKAQTVIGAGVDFDGNVWGVGHSNDTASRLDVDAAGNVKQPPTGTTKNVSLGRNPYTYSDFTGYALINFVRPQGRWSYLHKHCPPGTKPRWETVIWHATTPPGTAVTLRVRSGDSEATFGDWTSPFTSSPANIAPGAPNGVKPNPSALLQVEFTLTSKNKTTSPTLHDYAVGYTCVNVAG
jgi:hypothetical protein